MRLIRRILAIVALAPIALWLLCIACVMLLGFGFGCDINEGFATPCVVLGRDLSETAYSLGLFAAWGPLMFGPASLGGGFLWAVAVAIDRHRNRTPR
ncbi:hypothetical protein [Leisingera sp.]|uniref:hypothetical protein n=1 Tax=Leisingera sp. TaxID=1879318 RepID=UPI002B2647CD|nr:hypothetical protein [Leisingera sp.]